ncbi:MAG: hypothetical protein M0P33_01700 [Massilibacteroides sp.]|nr:hypothetical protein [Massilibacteroides sp.]
MSSVLVLHLAELRPEGYGDVPGTCHFSNNGLEIYKANSGVSSLPSFSAESHF